MSSEDTLIGNEFKFQIGNLSVSPSAFVDACSITDVSGLGESKSQIDVTSYCDDARTYIGGLQDGNEVTLTANLIQSAADLAELFSAWDAGVTVDFRFAKKDSPTDMYLEFSGTLLSWGFNAPVGDRAQLTFTMKITGGVSRHGF